jgi:hypothetical protein
MTLLPADNAVTPEAMALSASLAPDSSANTAIARQTPAWTPAEVDEVLQRVPESPLTLEAVAGILGGLLGPQSQQIKALVTTHGARVRQLLYGNAVVPMAPIEVSNSCASDCQFCGWRSSNRAMKRLKMDGDLAMVQAEYLMDLGIRWIEFVSGDDFGAVKDLLPKLVTRTRDAFERRGIEGKVSFCTMALTQAQYARFREAGADNTIVWQETYDHQVYEQHVHGGPKAYGIDEDWRITKSGNGCDFRIDSQRRALEAGLEVGLGAMLGLSADLVFEFVSTVDHARRLGSRYRFDAQRPMIIGMPVWNAITTRETDLRPAQRLEVAPLFPSLAALYLLALPSPGTWVFPNCRVPLSVQVEAARVAGAFSSTEVKLGPGGYLPSVIARGEASGQDMRWIRERVAKLVREADADTDVATLSKLLDEREQFQHHYHSHQRYQDAMAGAGLRLIDGVVIPTPAGF